MIEDRATVIDERGAARLANHYRAVRALSLAIAATLSDADATIQSAPDVSPIKWHLGHSAWFFETFVLGRHLPGYQPYQPDWAYLFNSYYEGEGARLARGRRGMLSRPTLDEVLAWRRAVDDLLVERIEALPPTLIELGLKHEQQHQELMLMDMKAIFFENPLHPAVWASPAERPVTEQPAAPAWHEGRARRFEIGADADGFAFDCERPRHPVLLPPHNLADRPVTNGEWLGFIADGGYSEPRLWLADGWAWVMSQAIEAPLYWLGNAPAFARFGLDGVRPLDPAAPVCHVSFFEADAFARWSGKRLPTEFEWEAAASGADPSLGHQLDTAGPVEPRPTAPGTGLRDLFGNVWEWTSSAFLPYPGFVPAPGSLGEYNGKFMASQMVLRGGCCASPRGHVDATYRNFYYPHQRWMFAGLRLASDS